MSNPLPIYIALLHFQPEKLRQLQLISADQKNLAINNQRRMEQLIGRSWRRQILATQLNQTPENLHFAIDGYGKPFLVNYPDVQLSQSHCTRQLVLVFNQQGVAIGVDIENKQRRLNLAGLAQRILSKNEMQCFLQSANPQAYLLRCWTIKEAVLKASGLGIRLNLNTLDTQYDDMKMQASDLIAYQSAIGQWSYHCFETADYYYTIAWPYHVAQPVHFNWLD